MKKGIFAFIIIIFLLFNVAPIVGAEGKPALSWQDESIYLIMVDRFNNGDPSNDTNVDVNNLNQYQGGDLQGIIDKLDYIKEMGFTTILLTPIFDNSDGGYHGYWINDYYKIDEHFGSMKTFKKLVEEAHKRGLNVMLDFVISHTGSKHPWSTEPEKKDWFLSPSEETKVENNNVLILNQDNPDVREYLIKAAKWWIDQTDIDGYQITSFTSVSNSFLAEFSKEVKAAKSEFYLLGDFITTIDQTDNLSKFKQSGMDGFVDYDFQRELRKVFPKPNQSFAPIVNMGQERIDNFSNPLLMANILDNQNTFRFTRDMIELNEHPGPRWKQALTYLFTTPGIPVMFYGSEIALDGVKAPDNLKMMNFRTDPELVDYIKKIAGIRSMLPAITKGTMDVLYEKDGFIVYKRSFEDQTVVVALNNTTKTQTVSINAEELAAEKELRGALNGDLVRSKDNKYTLTIDRDESEIYVLSNISSINLSYIFAIAGVLIVFFVFLFLVKKKSRA